MKKLLSLSLVAVFILACATTALAAETVTNDDFTITNVIDQGAYDAWEDEEEGVAGLARMCYIVAEGATLSFTEGHVVTVLGFTNPEVDENKDVWFDWVDAMPESVEIQAPTVLKVNTSYRFGYSYVAAVDAKGQDLYNAINIEIYVVDSSIAAQITGEATPAPAPAPTPAPAPAPATQTVNPTPSTVYVDGAAQAFEAYNIGGNNFFKLRDLAMVLNGSGKQFAVGYDNATKAITLTGGQAYAAAGGELAQGDGTAKTATPSASSIYLDGAELSLTIYNIGGNNFFKLRDLMEALDVYVGYDEATKAITLDSTQGYAK